MAGQYERLLIAQQYLKLVQDNVDHREKADEAFREAKELRKQHPWLGQVKGHIRTGDQRKPEAKSGQKRKREPETTPKKSKKGKKNLTPEEKVRAEEVRKIKQQANQVKMKMAAGKDFEPDLAKAAVFGDMEKDLRLFEESEIQKLISKGKLDAEEYGARALIRDMKKMKEQMGEIVQQLSDSSEDEMEEVEEGSSTQT